MFVGLTIALVACAGEVTVLFTNDLHARLGRLAALGSAIEDARAAADHVVLVDAGDAWHDFRLPVLTGWGGSETVRWMNSVGYDAMAIGNHEFAIGAERLAELVAAAEFPILGANVIALEGMGQPVGETVRLYAGSQEILIAGLTTAEFFPTGMIPWMRIESPLLTLDCAVSEEDQKRHQLLVVVLAHFGVREAIEVARAAPWIDLIVTGHTHSMTESPVLIDRTLIVQGSAFAQGLGRIDLVVDDRGEITDWRLEQVAVEGPALDDRAGEGRRRLGLMCVLSAICLWAWWRGG